MSSDIIMLLQSIIQVGAIRESNPELFEKAMNGIDEIVGQCVVEIQTKKEAKPELISKNQEYLQQLGVSHPTLDLIVKLAAENGLSAKLTGAGGGGCAFILVPPSTSPESLQPLLKALTENNFEFWDTLLGCKGFHVC